MAYVRYRFGSAEDLQNGYVVTKAMPICTAQLLQAVYVIGDDLTIKGT